MALEKGLIIAKESSMNERGHMDALSMYELTAMALEQGLDSCRDSVEQRVMYYEQRLRYWTEHEKICQQNWTGFLKK